jgi:hypothetical protein
MRLPKIYLNGQGGYRDVDPDVLQYHTDSECPRVQEFPEIRNQYVNDPRAEGLEECSRCRGVRQAKADKRRHYGKR